MSARSALVPPHIPVHEPCDAIPKLAGNHRVRAGPGCGVPTAMSSDMCDACAGFARPPPAPPDDDLELVYPDVAGDDLELVYPEDAAQAACASTTTLASDDAQTSQPRRPTPRCNETLPAHSRMDWTPFGMQRTRSLETTTSAEEKEVAAMLDDMSDAAGNQRAGIPGWDSDLTDLSDSDSDSGSTSDGSTSNSDVEPDGDTANLKIRIPLLVTQLPPGSALRKCKNKRCNIVLPKEHRWKTCDACRGFQRMYQRLRAENARRGVLGMEPLPFEWRSLSSEPDPPLTSRRCSSCQKKRLPLPEVYPWKTCDRCRAKSRRKWYRRRNAALEDIVPRAPAYQNRAALLSSFEAQLRGFVEGQLFYYRAKLCESAEEPWKLQDSSMVFVFAGEYSVVIGQRGDGAAPEADEEAMRRDASGVVAELERMLRAALKLGEVDKVDKGIRMRFTCALELIARLRPEGESTPAVPLVKGFSGELEVVIVPDESHHLFHGRRTVLRYRMVG